MTTLTTESTFDHWTFNLRRDLDALFRAKLPAQWVEVAMDLVLSEASPLITPEAHTAAIRRETDWQAHWMAKHEAAQVEIGRILRALDLTATERVNRMLALIGNQRPSRTAKHDETCHERHAACLATRIRAALNGDVA